MNSVQIPDNDRLHDLLAEEATVGLSDADRAELDGLISDLAIDDLAPDAFDEAAAACSLMWADPAEEVPASCKAKLVTAAEKHIASRGAPDLKLSGTPADASLSPNPLAMFGGWIAAAACLVVAVVLSTPSKTVATPADQLASLLEADPNVSKAGWLSIDQVPPLNASAPHRFDEGITGEIVWSESRDEGYMVLSGIAENDPQDWVYQLWIFDKTRDDGGLAQRPVDGGVFDFASAKRDESGNVIVPIDAKLPVGEAFLFAVTVEEPGGVVVSDRDVVFVAALG